MPEAYLYDETRMTASQTTLDIVERLFEEGVLDSTALADRVEALIGRRPSNNSLANYRSLFKRFGPTWRQELRSMNRDWAKANPDKKQALSRAWGRANPARMLLGQAKQRAKRLGVPCTLTELDIEALLAGLTCSATRLPLTFEHPGGGSLKNPWAPSLDRVKRSFGYVAGNVRVVCWLYNHMRGDYADADVQRVAKALVEAE
jgi:hypothetical protein